MSSNTAVVTGPIGVGGWVNTTPGRGEPGVLGLDVVDREGRERDAVGDQRLLERAGRRVLVGLEHQLDAVAGLAGSPR